MTNEDVVYRILGWRQVEHPIFPGWDCWLGLNGNHYYYVKPFLTNMAVVWSDIVRGWCADNDLEVTISVFPCKTVHASMKKVVNGTIKTFGTGEAATICEAVCLAALESSKNL